MKDNPIKSTEMTLAIETSGRIGSVALGRGCEPPAESTFSGFMKQSAELLPRIQQMLAAAKAGPSAIKTVILTIGPGSFTGLRIAVTAAKMLYYTHQARIVAVDSMDVIAENAPDTVDGSPVDCVCTILDAKRDLFYAAVFDRTADGWTKVFGTEAITAADLLDRLADRDREKVWFLGEGLVYYARKFEAPFTAMLDESFWTPRAAGLYRVGMKMAAEGTYADPHALAPRYLRKPDAVERKNR